MQVVHLIRDPLNLAELETHEVEDARALLVKEFPTWPETARIYRSCIAACNDVTPRNALEVENLASIEDPLYVVVYPAGGVISGIFSIVSSVFSFIMPRPPTPSVRLPNQGNSQDSSPNNQLGDRVNTPRLNGRIPDVFGTVRSTPDLVSVPYRIYRNHQEVEISYMCIGRGTYDVSDIRDGDTDVSQISGTTVEVWAPGTSPNTVGGTPQIRIGSAIPEKVVKATSQTATNGQTLRAPNADNVVGVNNIRGAGFDTIQANNTSEINFQDAFETGDTVTVTNFTVNGTYQTFTLTNESMDFILGGQIEFAQDPRWLFSVGDTFTLANASRTNGVQSGNFNGAGYTVTAVTATRITISNIPAGAATTAWSGLSAWPGQRTGFMLSNISGTAGNRTGIALNGTYTVNTVSNFDLALNNPVAVNANWFKIYTCVGTATAYGSPTIVSSGVQWIGPFFMDIPDLTQVYANFIALNGIYKDNGTTQTRFDVTIRLECTPADSSGNAAGSPQNFDITLNGSSITRDTRAVTLKATPTVPGRQLVRARRLTNEDLAYSGTIVDDVKWSGLYGISPIPMTEFGDVTTVYSQTYATNNALSVKERKMNMLVTRKLPLRVSGSTFTPDLHATNSAAEIMSFMCKDPHIGNRPLDEIDFNSIYDSIAQVREYFGSDLAGEFSYTFDNNNLSFEESIATLARAVFCTAYRQGSVLKLKPELATEDSTLLFNHRNKLPGSETRTLTFGNAENHDGVELEYVNPDDDALDTYYIPADRDYYNASQVETIGVRNKLQAFYQAWRSWNKIQHQNTTTEFDCTQEAALTILNDRILVSDSTKVGTQDGEVLEQSGLVLTLSQKVTLDPSSDYVALLQMSDGWVETIDITTGPTNDTITLGSAPSLPLVLGDDRYAKTTYMIVKAEDLRLQAFLVAEKDSRDPYNYSLTCINYHSLYYQQDALSLWLDPSQGLIDAAPYESVLTPTALTVVNDVDRGPSTNGAGGTSRLVVTSAPTPSASYTKMGWIKKSDMSSVGNILSSTSGTNEIFQITAAGNLLGRHASGTDFVACPWPGGGTWHHAALTYDAATTTMKLFLDGQQVAVNTSVAQRSLAGLTLLGHNGGGGLVGRAQDVRLYRRVLSPSEIQEIYKVNS